MVSSFYIYNSARERIGILQHETSVQWLESYQAPGEAKIEAQATADNLAMLVEGNRVYNTDSESVARIAHVDIVETEAGETITARGQLTGQLLADRVVMATENVTNVEAGMYSLYRKNRRGLPLNIATAEGYTEKTDTEITWNSVLEGVTTLAEASGLGFKVLFNPETGVETYKVYRGIDRSDEGSPDYVGYFGQDVGNIQNITLTTGSTNYKNVAVVAGAGEGADRIVRIVSLGNVSGEARREMYVDARDLQRDYQVATPTGEVDEDGNPVYDYEKHTYTDAEYNALLDARGREKLAEQLRDFEIICDIAQVNILYGQDYHLGDRLPIKLPDYGIYASARISAVTMVYEASGRTITATLSDFALKEV